MKKFIHPPWWLYLSILAIYFFVFIGVSYFFSGVGRKDGIAHLVFEAFIATILSAVIYGVVQWAGTKASHK